MKKALERSNVRKTRLKKRSAEVNLAISFRGWLETFTAEQYTLLEKAYEKPYLQKYTFEEIKSAEVNLAISFRGWAESPAGHWTALAMVTGQN